MMSLTLQYPSKAKQELSKTAETFSEPQQQWRSDNRVRHSLTSNLALLRELYRMANHDLSRVRELVNECEKHVRQAVVIRQQPQQLQQMLNLPPNHPSIINNINHPLNPGNPNNLMLNPAMNLNFQQAEAIQAAIEENEIEESAENELASQTVIDEILQDENLHQSAQAALEKNPELDPHKELGLPADASSEQIEAACLASLAENAPEASGKSEKFEKVAAASMMLGFGHEHLQQEKHQESQMSMQQSM